MNWNILFDTLLAKTRMILEHGMEVLAVAFIIKPNEPPIIIGLPYKNEKEKLVLYAHVSQKAREENAIGVFLINDTWIRPMGEAIYGQLVLPDGSVSQSTVMPYKRDGGRIVWGPTVHDPASIQKLLPPWKDTKPC
jgi:hypothetical protein